MKIVGTGKDTRLVFKNADDGFSKDNLKTAFSGDTITFDLTVSQAGNGSFHAAETVTRTIKLKKPTKNLFFEERKSDARYDDLKNAALTRIAAKRGISGEKALALFNSDNYDSDGDGVSNLLERAFGGDSLGNDSRGARPAPVKANDNKEYLFYTVQLRLPDIDGSSIHRREKFRPQNMVFFWGQQVGTAVDLGGGMERVVMHHCCHFCRFYPVHPCSGKQDSLNSNYCPFYTYIKRSAWWDLNPHSLGETDFKSRSVYQFRHSGIQNILYSKNEQRNRQNI